MTTVSSVHNCLYCYSLLSGLVKQAPRRNAWSWCSKKALQRSAEVTACTGRNQPSAMAAGGLRPWQLCSSVRKDGQGRRIKSQRKDARGKEWAASQSSSAQTFTCRQCSGVCTSRIGLYSHQRACKNWPSTMPNPHLRRTSHHHHQQQRDYKLVNSIHNCIWHIQCYYSLNQLVSNWTGGIPKYIVYLPHTDRYISHSCPTSSVELARWGENGMLLSAMVSWVSSRKVT